MQSFSASNPDRRPRLLVLELWGLGDLALAVPFLRLATHHGRVTVVAKPHAGPVLKRFCPAVELIPFHAPWTAHRGKYQLHHWPWTELSALRRTLRQHRYSLAASARPDPRDHLLMALAGAGVRAGFPRAGSGLLLTDRLPAPAHPHRAAHWDALATHLGWNPPATPEPPNKGGRQLVIHTGAAQPTRQWGHAKFEEIARRLRTNGWQVTLIDETSGGIEEMINALTGADRFLGNDSGPGHLAALLGVPTFTIFGAQTAANFSPSHPRAAWIEGAPCRHKPCNDYCRFDRPHCILDVTVDEVWTRLSAWLAAWRT